MRRACMQGEAGRMWGAVRAVLDRSAAARQAAAAHSRRRGCPPSTPPPRPGLARAVCGGQPELQCGAVVGPHRAHRPQHLDVPGLHPAQLRVAQQGGILVLRGHLQWYRGGRHARSLTDAPAAAHGSAGVWGAPCAAGAPTPAACRAAAGGTPGDPTTARTSHARGPRCGGQQPRPSLSLPQLPVSPARRLC